MRLVSAMVILVSCTSCAVGPADARRKVFESGGSIMDFGILTPDTEIHFDSGGAPRGDAAFAGVWCALRALRPFRLELDDSEISDASVPHLSQIQTIRDLSLGGTSVSTQGAQLLLTSLPKLGALRIEGSAIPAQDANALRREFPHVQIRRVTKRNDWWEKADGEP